jgi:hypothetical protein
MNDKIIKILKNRDLQNNFFTYIKSITRKIFYYNKYE